MNSIENKDNNHLLTINHNRISTEAKKTQHMLNLGR